MKKSRTKKEFIDEMEEHGYKVLWTDERKYITYTCPNSMKCRDIKLHQEKYRKEKMELEFELRRIETEKRTAESYVNRFDFNNGESNISNDSGERLLESTDKFEQISESQARSDIARNGDRRADTEDGKSHLSRIELSGPKDVNDADRAEEDIDRTGWEAEREIFFAGGEDRAINNGYEEETSSFADWYTDSHSNRINDSLYFVGNLFEMINNQTRYHRKRIKLSQKEIQKKIAQGQKSDGYEEYEDYSNREITM